MDKATKHTLAEVLFAGSIVCALLAAWSYLVSDIWLASSQWLQMAAVLGIYATYMEIKEPTTRK